MRLDQPRFRFLVIPVRIGIVLLVCSLFVGVALAAGLIDSSVDDFNRGSGCYVSQADTGQTAGAVIITPTVGTNFSGTVLASGWFTQPGSLSLLSDGNLLVDQGIAGTLFPPLYTPSRTLEFAATFIQDASLQHAGFGLDLSDPPWAIFSTGSDGAQLRARTNNGVNPELNTPLGTLGTEYFNAPHLYRIDWSPTSIVYSIDGTPVVTHTINLTSTMHPIMGDSNSPGISLTLNWMRMSDYAPSTCTYTSRIINSGADDTAWANFTTTVAQPAGTSISFDVRAASTLGGIDSAPWQLVTSNNISATGRYVQYRAILTTTDPLVTPQLLSASFDGNPLAVTLKSISAAPTTPPGVGWLLAGLSGVGLLLGFYGYRLIRRRKHI